MSELTDAERTEVWAQRIEAAGLTPVAVSLLEIVRPLGFLAGQLLLLGEPLLVGLTSRDGVHGVAAWLEDPEQAERLLNRLLE